MLSRDSERNTQAFKDLPAIGGNRVVCIPCDLTSFNSVKEAARRIQETFPDGIHILVYNAGVMALGDKKVDGYDIQMITNHLSHFLLTKELFQLLEKGADMEGEARIVDHSSEARKGPILDAKYFSNDGKPLGGDSFAARFARYQQTKLANIVFTLALHDKLSASGSKVKALVCHPGLSATNLQGTSSRDGPSSFVLQLLLTQGQSANDGTVPLLISMTDPKLQSGDFYGPTEGMGRMRGYPKKHSPEKECTKEGSKKLLWELSEKAIGSTFDIGD